MEKDYLKRQLDSLWDNVNKEMQKRNDASPSYGGQTLKEQATAAAFESTQSEMQAESLKLLRTRFEKEKSYWENLITSKEQVLAGLQNEIRAEQEKNQQLRSKIQELQDGQTLLLKQTFSALDLQKRALTMRIEQLEKDLEEFRKTTLAVELDLKEERTALEQLKLEWAQKERKWMDERDQKNMEVQKTKQELLLERQADLAKIASLEKTIKDSQNQLQEEKTVHEAERASMKKMLDDRESLASELQNERAERAVLDAEIKNQGVKNEEDKKKLSDEILKQEDTIKELKEAIDQLKKQKTEQAEAFKNREKDVLLQEEALRKRREEWVDSIKNQSTQQLNISEKVTELLNKVEGKVTGNPAETNLGFSKDAARAGQEHLSPAQQAKRFSFLELNIPSFKKNRGIAMILTGVVLLSLSGLLLFMDNEGRKIVQAQKYLEQGNEEFTKGELQIAAESLQKAYKLDPENSMIKNSLALVLGEVANNDFKAGNFEEALRRTEFLHKILPEDPDVLALHNNILKSLGRSSEVTAPTAVEPKTD